MINLKKKILILCTIIILILSVIYSPIKIRAAESKIRSNAYKVQENYILNIAENTTKETFLDNIEIKNDEEVKIYKSEQEVEAEEIIGTGMKLKVGEEVYNLVINGDVNGDGKVSTLDISILRKVVVKTEELEGAYMNAGDINKDGRITTLDISKIRMHVVGLINLNEVSEEPKEEIEEKFAATIIQKINNKIVVSGLELDKYLYYYSKDNGETWEPEGGTREGRYEFNNIEADEETKIKVKKVDEKGEEKISEAKEVKLFDSATEIIRNNMDEVTIEENNIVKFANGAKYEILNTEDGGYSILFKEIPQEVVTIEDPTTGIDKEILEAIENLEINVAEENAEEKLLNKAVEEGIIESNKVNIANKTFVTQNENVYMVFLDHEDIEEAEETDEDMVFRFNYMGTEEEYNKNQLTTQKLNEIRELEENLTSENKIDELLEKIIEEEILEEDKVNQEEKIIEMPNGNKYEVKQEETDNEIILEIIIENIFTEEMSIANIQSIEKAIEKGIANQIIDWAIEDEVTTEENANREEGYYTANDGKRYDITVDVWFGNYYIMEHIENEG